ncbi:MAG TPA: autotransporter domain-containing protein [Candidimonas sp.]|nr:autotransporter domain-containing protein [Candidimonas sp.]
MMIRNASQSPQEVCCVRYVVRLLAGLLSILLATVAVAQTPWIYNEAQWGPPNVPFAFSGGTLYTAGSFTSDRSLVLDTPGHIHTQVDTDLHLSGTISAPGATIWGLEKSGLGTLTLSGHNTYRGNTTLREGMLHVAGAQALGEPYRMLEIYEGAVLSYAPGATLFNAVQLWTSGGPNAPPPLLPGEPVSADPAHAVVLRVDEGEARQAGMLFSEVPVIKKGAGTLRFTGIATLPSFATVDQGGFAVDGHFSGSVLVNAAGRLEGNGTVRSATVRAGGTLSPGGGAGTLGTFTVADRLEFKPGAVFQVDVTPSGLSDYVQVGGKALLDGAIQARAGAGDWLPGTSYRVLFAGAGFDGTRFASVGTDLAFLEPSLRYDDHNVYLRLDRNGVPLDDVAETPTEDDVADVVDQDEVPGIKDEIIVMDGPQAQEAFRQLSGSWFASLRSGLLDDSRFVREAFFRHGAAHGPARTWSQGFYSSGRRASWDGTPGDTRELGGFVAGADRPVNAFWRAGGFVGAQDSDRRRAKGLANGSISSLHAGAGLSGRLDIGDVAMGVSYAWHAIRSHRKIAVAGLRDMLDSNYRGRTLQVFSELAAPLRRLSDAFTIQPFGRAALVWTHTDGVVERGGPAALRVLPQRQSILAASAGLRASGEAETPAGVAQWRTELAWHHAGGDVRAFSSQHFRDSGRQTVFTSEGLPAARRAWSLQVGADVDLARNMRAGVAYAGHFGKGAADHGARLDLNWVF